MPYFLSSKIKVSYNASFSLSSFNFFLLSRKFLAINIKALKPFSSSSLLATTSLTLAPNSKKFCMRARRIGVILKATIDKMEYNHLYQSH